MRNKDILRTLTTVLILLAGQSAWAGTSFIIAASGDEHTITYVLAGGSGATANPVTYTTNASVTISAIPIRAGYAFAGWTGSNGSTPQTTVVISAGSSGAKSYTANWTPLWGQDSEADGSRQHPFIITTTEGLDMLAKVVDGLDGFEANSYEGKYFELGADISYSTDGIGQRESNYTAIGGYYNGSDKDFSGSFDGKHYVVSGIRIYKPLENKNVNKNQGLFGRTTNATIQNVTIYDANISGYSYVGGIVGNSTSGSVKNCRVIGSHFTYMQKRGGSILGYSNNCTLSANYYHDCTVTVNETISSTGIGVGENGTSSSDQNDARSMHTLTLGNHLSASGTSIIIKNTTYYPSAATITLHYDNLPEGGHVSYSYNDGTDHAISGTSFVMPAADVTVSACVTSVLDDFQLVQGSKDGVTAWWGTFYDSDYNFTLSEGAAAYTLDSDFHLYRLGDDGRTIPKGTAVVIISTVPDATLLPAGTGKLSIAVHGGKNILVGSDIAMTYDAFCVLSAGTSGEIGFFTLQNITVPAFKAGYLPPTNGGLQDYGIINKKW